MSERSLVLTVLILGISCLILSALWLWQLRKQRRLSRTVNQLMDAIIEKKPLPSLEIKEGASSPLAAKAARIQEQFSFEVARASHEREEVKSLISNMSHQLKTPLANVMLYQELLCSDSLDEQQRQKFQQKLRNQTEKTDWILRSLFKMTRLENGAITFDISPLPIRPTILQAVSDIYEKAQKKEIEILTGQIPDVLLLHNQKWTAEAIGNILENAVKYSNPGTLIRIWAEPLELYTQIHIQDEGMGISPEEYPWIFQRFYRSPRAESKEGSGIGLYLTRLILEQEKGYVTVSSHEGRGSLFTVFLQNCKNPQTGL